MKDPRLKDIIWIIGLALIAGGLLIIAFQHAPLPEYRYVPISERKNSK